MPVPSKHSQSKYVFEASWGVAMGAEKKKLTGEKWTSVWAPYPSHILAEVKPRYTASFFPDLIGELVH